MIAQMGSFSDPKMALQIQLWCTIGIGAILEALEIVLANGDVYAKADTVEVSATFTKVDAPASNEINNN